MTIEGKMIHYSIIVPVKFRGFSCNVNCQVSIHGSSHTQIEIDPCEITDIFFFDTPYNKSIDELQSTLNVDFNNHFRQIAIRKIMSDKDFIQSLLMKD